MLEYTEEAARPVDRDRLGAIQLELGVELPESYQRFLLTHNGGRPIPSDFTVVENGQIVQMRIHFFFGIDDDAKGCDLLWNYYTLKDRLPRHVIAIASDEVGNRFCLDLSSQGSGRVLFWDHEIEDADPRTALTTVVAESFGDWQDMLVHAS